MSGGLLHFGATQIPPAATGGVAIRHYILDCEHGTTELDLPEKTGDDDLLVMAQLILDHRHAIFETEAQLCDCRPLGYIPEAARA